MRNLIPSSRRAITLAVMAGLSLPVVAQDNPVEEVVVTGSQSGTIHAIGREKAFAPYLALWGIPRNGHNDT